MQAEFRAELCLATEVWPLTFAILVKVLSVFLGALSHDMRIQDAKILASIARRFSDIMKHTLPIPFKGDVVQYEISHGFRMLAKEFGEDRLPEISEET